MGTYETLKNMGSLIPQNASICRNATAMQGISTATKICSKTWYKLKSKSILLC